ncbi:MAG: putative toxin-antitoxin system toxin component, PIN family [Tepidisphaeraceae bacterium]|jgi:putative PIN family toxin of toxin-antitoxin system
MHVVVFDTNVLLSAIGWGGKPNRCLEAARSGVVEGVTCLPLLEELEEKLKTLLRFSPAEVTDQLADLLGFLTLMPISGALRGATSDPGDDKVLECADTARATHIITGDRRHLLPMKNYKGIQIVTAAAFLEMISKS